MPDHQYTIKNIKPSRIQLIITKLSEKLLQQSEERVLEELSKELRIKGFRPGKIPHDMIRQQVEASYITLKSIERAFPKAADEILEHEKVRAIGKPEISYESIDPLKILLTIDVYPKLTVGDYKNITVKVKTKKATEKELEQALEDIQRRMTEFKSVERAAITGDRIEIDFEGFTLQGEALPNTASKHHPTIIGSNLLIPGFEEELVGLKKSDTKEFKIRFPKDYHVQSLAHQEVLFKVKVHQVEEAIPPTLDEAFIEKISGKKQSFEDWKKELQHHIQQQHDRNALREREEEYFDALVKVTSGEVPGTMIEEEQQQILKEMKERILSSGFSYESYLKSTKKTEEELIKSFELQAQDRIRLRMALQEIAVLEKIEVSELEVEEKINDLFQKVPNEEKEKAKKLYQPGTAGWIALRYQLLMQKTLEKILPKV